MGARLKRRNQPWGQTLYSAAVWAYRGRMLHHAAMTMIIKTTALAGAGVWSWLPAAD
ncbi:MAG: hypothetical protein Q8N19_11030 [Phenylobacterium sp.]|uniref:hypothetical protein n=1 Tax=Phenylobacterium sp. TaxID=1871053 RepID=UPI0027330EB9|nr:hypothetical protein [Phenylobacterium sp.]MDP3117630.1 hypothetical protein [Phenylobacterium sp.]MDP3383210.1 hypothetical protein [Phenylobacterium sp.]